MKKKQFSIIAIILFFTASAVYQIKLDPLVQSIMDQLKEKSSQGLDELVYLHIDRTFYQPGETVWLTGYIRDANDRQAKDISEILHIEVYKPNGTLHTSHKVLCAVGNCHNSFKIPKDKGGIYTIRAFTNWQKNRESFFEKKIQVQHVLLPNLNMTLDFERKAYGAGDKVIADLELESLDNQVLSNTPFTYKVTLSSQEVLEFEGITDKFGKAKLEFNLPDSLLSNEGILNVRIPYRGLRESIARPIPIVLNNIDLTFFPEGGDLIAGQTSFIAFEAINEFGKAADVSGHIEDVNGRVLRHFSSLHNGLGKFAFEGKTNESYFAKLTKPIGINKLYKLPEVETLGTTISILNQDKAQIKVAIQSTVPERLHLLVQHGDSIYFARTFQAQEIQHVNIPTKHFPIGIARLTIFNDLQIAQCERLIFLNKHKKLNIEIETNKSSYQPREKIEVKVKVTDENGEGVKGDFSISVSDDKLMTYADDKQGHILSKVLLESELKGKIEEPNFYFDEKEEQADAALDLLMMTHGWRRFEWKTVLENAPKEYTFNKEKMIISGEVKDIEGKLKAGVKIRNTSDTISSITDEKGRFYLKGINLLNQSINIIVEEAGLEIGRKLVNEYGHYHIEISPLKGHLSGIVYDQKTAICRSCTFTVKNEQATFNYSTDQYGMFGIYNLSAGKYTVSLLDTEGKVVGSKSVKVNPSSNNFVHLNFANSDSIEALSTVEVSRMDTINKTSIVSTQGTIKPNIQVPLTRQAIVPKMSKLNQIDEGTAFVGDTYLYENSDISLSSITVTSYKIPMIDQDDTTQGGTLTSDQISNLPIKDVGALAVITAGVSQIDEGDGVSIRGSRAGAVDYYIDGIRVSTSGGISIPASEIDQIQVITGGLEARYGGGIVDIPRYTASQNSKLPNAFDWDDYDQAPSNQNYISIIGSGGNPGGIYYPYDRYKRPRVIYALPPNKFNSKNKKKKYSEFDPGLIVQSLKKNLDKNPYYNNVCLADSIINVQFVVDKKGRIGDIKITDRNNKELKSSDWWIRSALYSLQRKKTAKSIGLSRGLCYNIQLELEELLSYSKSKYKQQRRFYQPRYYKRYKTKTRNDFRSTVYWNPSIRTDAEGKANISFWNADDITKYNITVEGFAKNGLIGRGEASYAVNTPFAIIAKVPRSVIHLDTVSLPVTLINSTAETLRGKLKVNFPSFCIPLFSSSSDSTLSIKPEEAKSLFLDFVVSKTKESNIYGQLSISFESENYYDAFVKRIKLLPRGYPHHYTFTDVELRNEFNLEIKDAYKGSIRANFKAHPSPLSEVASNIDKIIRQPYGCFEQTTSANYPNLLALKMMKESGITNQPLLNKSNGFLKKGYERLLGFEMPNGGFSLYGRSSAKIGLSAMGLLQFKDMSEVYPVDEGIIKRTANWLLMRRDGKGAWKKGSSKYNSPDPQLDVYTLFAMCEAGYARDLTQEIEAQYLIVDKSEDAYMMALMANVLFRSNDKRADKFLKKLVRLQSDNGGWAGAKKSVTYSTGRILEIESTALALLAITKSTKQFPVVKRKALNYILKSKNKYGFGSTQSTTLCLKALIATMQNVKETDLGGEIELLVNGIKVKHLKYLKGQAKFMDLKEIPALQKAGEYKVEVNFINTKQAIPFEIEVAYTAKKGQKNEDTSPIELKTKWNKQTAKMGDLVLLTASIENKTPEIVSSPLAIIAIPGGLTVQAWQLKKIEEKGIVAYYELEADRLVLYMDHMTAYETKTIKLDLKAEIPGVYQASVSEAYPYYNNENPSFAISTSIDIRQ